MTQFEGIGANAPGLAIFAFEWGSIIGGFIGVFLLGVFAGLLKMAIQKLGCLGSACVFGGFVILLYGSTILGVLVPGVPWAWFSLAICVAFIIALPLALRFVKKKD